MKRIIVIAPHADDEILGCCATIAKYISNKTEVFIVIATNAFKGDPILFTEEGIKRVRSEALDAHRLLGVKETFFLDFPAPMLNAYPEYKISLALSELFMDINPTGILIPHPCDLHQDHKAIYRASLVSSRPLKEHKIQNILCYETLSETEWAPLGANNTFIPNLYNNVSAFFGKKIEAMKLFKSQLREFPNPRSLKTIEALATYRGSTVGVDKAEAFFVERIIL
jgi:LmbE family N-acetylglucosaminyl deacetylase